MTYWKIEELRKLLEIEKEDNLNKKATITRNYLSDLRVKIKLMEEAYECGLKECNSESKPEPKLLIEGKPATKENVEDFFNIEENRPKLEESKDVPNDICKCGHDKKEHYYEGYLNCSLCNCKKFQFPEKCEPKRNVKLYCKNPECFGHYLLNNKIKCQPQEKSIINNQKDNQINDGSSPPREMPSDKKGCGKEIEYRKNDEVVVESKCGFLEGKEIKLCDECKPQEQDVLCKCLNCGASHYTKEKDELFKCPMCNCMTKHKYKEQEKCECIFAPSGKKTYECDRCSKLNQEQGEPEELYELIKDLEDSIKSLKGKSTHGNCCTCQDCKNYHDECNCETIKKLESKAEELRKKANHWTMNDTIQDKGVKDE